MAKEIYDFMIQTRSSFYEASKKFNVDVRQVHIMFYEEKRKLS